MKKYFNLICLAIALLVGFPLCAQPFNIGATGMWAPKNSGFSGGGGGAAVTVGYQMAPSHSLELEGLWLDQTAKPLIQTTLSRAIIIATSDSVTSFTGTANTTSKFTLNRFGGFLNYRFTNYFSTEAPLVGFYLGGGLGLLYAHVKTTATTKYVGTYTITTSNGSNPMNGPETLGSPSTITHYWTPAAQLFGGISLLATDQLTLRAGVRFIFSNSKAITPYSHSWITTNIKYVQSLVEGGLSFSF